MTLLRRATGILWIVGGALVGLAFAVIEQQPLARVYVLVGIADAAILLGQIGAAFLLRRLPFLIGFLLSAAGWALLTVVALVALPYQTASGLLVIGQDVAAAGVVVAGISALILRRSRVILVALAVSTLIYFFVGDVFSVLLAAVLVVVGVVVMRRGFVGR